MNERVTVRNIMVDNVVTVNEDDSLNEIAIKLAENRISGAPVINGTREVVGIISDGDILRYLNTYDSGIDAPCPIDETASYKVCKTKFGMFSLEPTEVADIFEIFEKASSKKACDVMVKPAITASPDDEVEKVSLLMFTKKIKRVPIVEDGHLTGIVTRADIVKYVANRGRAKEFVSGKT